MGEALNEAVGPTLLAALSYADAVDLSPHEKVDVSLEDLREAVRTLEALEAERDALRKALEPFDRFARSMDTLDAVGAGDEDAPAVKHIIRKLTFGDFRRARQALTGAPDHG